MTQEQKARRYDEAVSMAKKFYTPDSNNVNLKATLRMIFPEFAENEDEKIRKELIAIFKREIPYTPYTSEEDAKRYIAWLEKQGEKKVSYTTIVETGDGGINALVTRELPTDGCDDEQKPTDKVKPKFKIGEWITNGDYTWKIVEVKPLDYILQSQNGNIVDDTISHVDEQFHSFTIEDAKDGDVLASKDGESILIFRNLDTGTSFSSYYNIEGKGELGWSNDCFIPATKEQRDLLFQKMKEAGYEWNANKKESKLLITNGGDFDEKNCEQKHSIDINKMVDDYANSSERGNEEFGKPVPCMIRAYRQGLNDAIGKVVRNPAWSDEDEAHINGIIDYLFDYKLLVYEEDMNVANGVQKELDWLESIKEKVQPQNTWKPSDEQITALSDINLTGCISYAGQGQELINLYNDLKKLKG